MPGLQVGPGFLPTEPGYKPPAVPGQLPGAPPGYVGVPTTQPLNPVGGAPAGPKTSVSPTYTTDPNTGMIDRFDPTTGSWTLVGSDPSRGGGASANRLGSASLQALQRLYQPTPAPAAPGTYTAPTLSTADYTAANQARMTTARQQGATRAQAALRTLAGLDAATGRVGSGLENANQRSILESEMSGLDDTQRQIIQDEADRQAAVENENFQAQNQAGELTYQTQSAYPMQAYQAALADKARIGSLLQSFGYVY